MDTPTTLKELIRQAGGPAVIARTFGVTTAAVTNWTGAGEVPVERCMRLQREHGIPVTVSRPNDWADHWPTTSTPKRRAKAAAAEMVVAS